VFPKSPKPLTLLHWSVVAILLMAAILAAGTLWLSLRLQDEDRWVRHTLSVRTQIAEVMLLVQRVETSQRGYLLTGREVYLGPYENAATGLSGSLDALTKLVADNSAQEQTSYSLTQLVQAKLRELASTIDQRRAGHTEAALAIVNSDAGLRLMDQIRAAAAAMEAEEARLLAERQSRSRMFALLLQAGAGAGVLLICGLGVLVSFYTQRAFREILAARDQLQSTNQQLVREISERERLETQLRQSQKMEAIGQLTGGIAHDFNNMLGVITGSLELIKRRLKKGDFAINDFLEAAQNATERSAILTSRLLAFARQQPLAPTVVDANKMIAGMSELMRSTLGEHIRIETVLAGGLWATNADPHQLESAVLNIAINSRDAMPDGGKLTIETANTYLDEAYCSQHVEVVPGQYVMVAITDTGIGMSPDVVRRAFDPFFTTKPSGRGTGLGLSQVYGFIKQSHGHIKAYSEIGEGTTVKIYLPRFVGSGVELMPAVSAPVKTAEPGEEILVVEDDPLMRRLTLEALRELGYSVIESDNAIDALAILHKRLEVKMLLTDVVMPDLNGKKLADEATRIRPDLKILFTTGYTQNAVVHGGVLDAGVQFLSKPFTLERLATKVRAVLDQ
jgi:signal transduction histidine kinase